MTANATPSEAASADRLATAVHVTTLVAGFAWLLALAGQQWFRADEWTILTDRSTADALLPHNEHWFAFPILLLRGLLATVGLHSYLPYVAPTVALHVITAHLVWRIIRRGGGDAWVATAAAAVLLTLGAGFENVTLAVQVAFTAPLALGLGHVLLVDHPGPVGRRDAVGAVAATVAIAWSGIGLVMVAAAALTAALRRGWRAAAVAAGPPAVVYAAWWLAVGRGALGALPAPRAVAGFVVAGLTHAAGEILHIGAWGAVALVVLAGWLVWRWRLARGRAAAAFACAAAAVVAFMAGGILRADDGQGLARSSRYVAVAATLLLPAAGVALGRSAARRRPVRVAVVAAGVVIAGLGARDLVAVATARAADVQQFRRTLLAAVDLARGPGPVLRDVHAPFVTPGITLAEAMDLRARGVLGDAPVEPADRVAARGLLGVTVTRTPAVEGPAPALVAVAHADVESRGDCVALTPRSAAAQVALAVADDTALRVDASRDGTLVVVPVVDGITSPRPVRLTLPADAPRWLNLALGRAEVTLTLPPAGTTRLCGVAAP